MIDGRGTLPAVSAPFTLRTHRASVDMAPLITLRPCPSTVGQPPAVAPTQAKVAPLRPGQGTVSAVGPEPGCQLAHPPRVAKLMKSLLSDGGPKLRAWSPTRFKKLLAMPQESITGLAPSEARAACHLSTARVALARLTT